MPSRQEAGAAQVPQQQGAGDTGAADRERTRGAAGRRTEAGPGSGTAQGGAAHSDFARGEHTHSETPIPGPRAAHGRPQAGAAGGATLADPEQGRAVPADPGGPARAGQSAAPRPVVQRASVRGQILDALRVALAGGELEPGEVYSAPVLGERFGVSATPVREAMQQLAVEGAVEVVPNRGFRVVERGARELAELAEIRVLLEAPVMQRLARNVPAERWAELRPLADATARAAASGCRATYVESDRAFHRAVLALSGNEQLVRIADDLHRRAQWPSVTGPASRRRAALAAHAAEHTALLDALSNQDLAATQALVRDHFAGA
ncbi:GntR family transcriptional regulator [Streptomyces sp. NBC_00286]|uniref:GntR family transcriptional regulator n=1 Tax=Streptomyces sp. NBC_00286 TaxID=2975701 RepID=UPI002E281B5C|nr:FCD domain-containing protein [Streptomyces sp. NBC_00286]